MVSSMYEERELHHMFLEAEGDMRVALLGVGSASSTATSGSLLASASTANAQGTVGSNRKLKQLLAPRCNHLAIAGSSSCSTATTPASGAGSVSPADIRAIVADVRASTGASVGASASGSGKQVASSLKRSASASDVRMHMSVAPGSLTDIQERQHQKSQQTLMLPPAYSPMKRARFAPDVKKDKDKDDASALNDFDLDRTQPSGSGSGTAGRVPLLQGMGSPLLFGQTQTSLHKSSSAQSLLSNLEHAGSANASGNGGNEGMSRVASGASLASLADVARIAMEEERTQESATQVAQQLRSARELVVNSPQLRGTTSTTTGGSASVGEVAFAHNFALSGTGSSSTELKSGKEDAVARGAANAAAEQWVVDQLAS